MKEHEILGWREWISLPDLEINYLKCKIDTGARTSALHAFFVEPDSARNTVRFGIHPIQRREDVEIICTARFIDKRLVTDSGGHKEKRYVIETSIRLGKSAWPIEITLTNRDTMKFRMLLGRTAMRKNMLVNPNASFVTGKPDLTPYIKKPKQD
ncbi:MAG: RimK/LysX family protein [Arenicellales bacterium]